MAADCTAHAYRETRRDFIAGRVTLIGCPKLDPVDYSEKLAEIIRNNRIESIAVPADGGPLLRRAYEGSGKYK